MITCAGQQSSLTCSYTSLACGGPSKRHSGSWCQSRLLTTGVQVGDCTQQLPDDAGCLALWEPHLLADSAHGSKIVRKSNALLCGVFSSHRAHSSQLHNRTVTKISRQQPCESPGQKLPSWCIVHDHEYRLLCEVDTAQLDDVGVPRLQDSYPRLSTTLVDIASVMASHTPKRRLEQPLQLRTA